mmetsp:Transcript_3165/g.6993  ORF Transcript_3165/g.6993 Transcript_3165/m.6993 type:complete len:537 (+) Transcript_3165:136-1746(+)|eukprot:CAMPEP_0172317512 /NCGR_PEP_ID=MMETSP1058-20130122/31849_1 /TAXON_ID=83371 /ORGANISM="Detonula confervacea, Strain CCMP 353" /LENGTH=536 /DNA_ID=CAMNT_0013032091 /DNA_START=44 /DNA_END=1654 /DNA_ORIENTATION=-
MSVNSPQAYQLKTIRYQDSSRKVLLQNENGPCPLLAAANALLLRGVITLDPVCVRNGVAGTDDVVNMLANRALMAGNRNTEATQMKMATSNRSHHEFHLNEVLSILPNLQHGMDVNPKFTCGPNGIEYTNNLAAFDLLGVELVHGWLLDPQDLETASVVESKTYNEMIETVIHGNEAKEAVQNLETQLCEKEKMLEDDMISKSLVNKDDVVGTSQESESIDVTGIGEEESVQTNDNQEQCSGTEPAEANSPTNIDEAGEFNEKKSSQLKKSLTEDDNIALQKEIVDMRGKISELSLQITRSEVANAFLTSSGHQLTYHGLEQLHKHMGDDALCVFFRNNHFATLTKHAGVLYLLVTDLGYANNPEIVWEKLDNIDGNTEYTNEFFAKPTPRVELKPAAGPVIAPELLLAQRSQAESDYQLALAMSKGAANPRGMDDDEGRLIEAAKELSLKTYHGNDDAAVNIGDESATDNSRVDSDLEVAMAYQRAQVQSEHESEQLARQLQELEYARQRPAANPRRPAASAAKSASASSNCTVS